jgi:hypothetical protein
MNTFGTCILNYLNNVPVWWHVLSTRPTSSLSYTRSGLEALEQQVRLPTEHSSTVPVSMLWGGHIGRALPRSLSSGFSWLSTRERVGYIHRLNSSVF